jgi:rSAM/selenodomain-associated transferase 2
VTLSVVIPTLNEADRVAGCIGSAAEAGVEVLVVDGGSQDGTPDRARAAGALVIPAPAGRARQLAVGAREAHGDTVLFLHADTTLPRGWSQAVRGALDDPRVVGGAFRFRFDERSPALRVIEWGARLRGALLRLPYGDQGLFLRRAVLEEMGGVPQAPIMEDLDLVRAMRRRGRVALLRLPATTSARVYRARGTWRTWLRNLLAAVAWGLGFERERIAAWYRR